MRFGCTRFRPGSNESVVVATLGPMSSKGSRRVFQHVYMQGARFEKGALPLSATEELQRFQDLVEKVARSLFLREHPHRRRINAGELGVTDFDLAITRLSDGSVGVDLDIRESAETLDLDHPSIAERSRRLIEEAFEQVPQTGRAPDGFPVEALPDLARMGASLKEDETLTWAKTKRRAKRSRAILTGASMESLRLGLVLPEPQPEEALVNAYVVGVCSDPMKFDYKLDVDGKNREGRFSDPEMFRVLRSVCGFANRTPLVALSVMRDPKRGILNVLNVESLLPVPWAERLDYLANLKPGWLDGSGEAISEVAIQTAESFLFKVLDAELERPGVFPTPDGGIQMEWAVADDLEVMVSGGGQIRVFHDDEDDDGFLGTVGLAFNRVMEVLRDHGVS